MSGAIDETTLVLSETARALRLLANRFDAAAAGTHDLNELAVLAGWTLTALAPLAQRAADKQRLAEPMCIAANDSESLGLVIPIGSAGKDTARKCAKTRRAAKPVPTTRRTTDG